MKEASDLNYLEALKITAGVMLTGWRLLPEWWSSVPGALRDFTRGLRGLLGVFVGLPAILIMPLFVWLAPLMAALILADERKRQRHNAEAFRQMREHYGSMRQTRCRDREGK